MNGLLAMGAFDRELPSEEMRVAGDEAPESFSVPDPRRESELHLRPGIVHRLDKGTSGVMVVARTSAAREALKEQFAAHTIDREYVALCNGEVKSRTFATMHGRPPHRSHCGSPRTSSVASAPSPSVRSRSRPSVAASPPTSSCRLETGRTHQIRMHLAENATPVLGDPLYGKPPKNEAVRQLAITLGHQALHARAPRLRPSADRQSACASRRHRRPDFELALETLRALPG